MRAIDAAVLRGEAEPLRARYAERAKAHPNDVLVRVYQAWCLGSADLGWTELKAIAAMFPEVPWAHQGMGRIYLQWRMPDQALIAFRSALGNDRRFFPALTGLGHALRRQGQYEEAEAHYREALALSDDGEARGGLGLTLLAEGKLADAKAELLRAQAQLPDQPEVLLALGRLTREQDRAEALRYVNRLTQLAPKDRAARRAAAELLAEQGEKELAAKQFEALVKLGDKDPALLRRLAALHAELGNVDAQERALRQLDVVDKVSADVPLQLAALAERKGRLDESEARLLEAVKRDPRRVEARLLLARTLARRQQLREALDAYRAAEAAGVRSAELEAEGRELTARFQLPAPATGSVDQIYQSVSTGLFAFYAERLKAQASLGGKLKLRVHVDAQGKVQGVDVLEDTVLDPLLGGHAYFALKDAAYPRQQREPVFEFQLRPPPVKGK